MNIRRLIVGTCMLLGFAVPGLAQYPERPIKMIVPYPAGGPTDFVARSVGFRLGTAIGQSVVTENRPGANGGIGVEAVVKSAPDGYTLLFTVDTPLTVNSSLYDRVPYDVQRDLAPIGTVATLDTFVLAVHPSVPAQTVAEFLALVRSQPGKVTMAHAGNASPAHLVAALFAYRAGLDLIHVPYKGGAPATADLAGGQVASMFVPATNAVSLSKAGKIRPLAVTSDHRFAPLPAVPTLKEADLAQFSVNQGFWYALFAPAATPKEIVARLSDTLRKQVLTSAEYRESLGKVGMRVLSTTPSELSQLIQDDAKRWAEVVKASNIKPN